MPLTTLVSMTGASWGIFLASRWAYGVHHQRCLSMLSLRREYLPEECVYLDIH